MKYLLTSMLLLFCSLSIEAQSVSDKLETAFAAFERDAQMKNGIASLHVIDAATGKTVFSKNSNIGLSPASTQKVITSAAAYDMLGKDFRYTTSFAINKNDDEKNLFILPSGDPTLGSWRWKVTSEDEIIRRTVSALSTHGLKEIRNIVVVDNGWQSENIPGGWIWDDIANYYGAGADILNWRENQFDLLLHSGSNIGDDVQVKSTKPFLYNYTITSHAKAAAKGTGDNAYIYFPVGRETAVVRGTIPAGENGFRISGSIPSPRLQFTSTLTDSLKRRNINVAQGGNVIPANTQATTIYTHYSPPLDSISYWFLKRSINLYGEALVKTFAHHTGTEATTSNGVKELKKYWTAKNIGVESSELNMYDGSGLSPLNRVTTKAQVAILDYARKQLWYNSFLHGFPEYNQMKMKSGTINGVKGFSGYHKSAGGKEYIFSFLVNNYNGSASGIVQKMYKVLDVLK